MWVDSFFKAIGEALGFAKQERNPKVIRLNKLMEIDKELNMERIKRDVNMQIYRTPENEIKLATDLGIITDRIIELRQARHSLER